LEKKRTEHEEEAKTLDKERTWLTEKATEQIGMAKVLTGVASDVGTRLQAAGFNLENAAQSAAPSVAPALRTTAPRPAAPSPTVSDIDPTFLEAWDRAKELLMAGNVGSFGEIVELVPECINIIDKSDGNTLLHWAAAYNEVEMAKILVDNGARQVRNKVGKAPVDIAQDAYKRPDASYYNMFRLLGALPKP